MIQIFSCDSDSRSTNVCTGCGYVKTKMTKQSWLDKKKRKNRSERIILNRWATPTDIANTCIFLGSELSNYINGQEMNLYQAIFALLNVNTNLKMNLNEELIKSSMVSV